MYTQITIKTFLLFFFTIYKNEWKEHKFQWQKKPSTFYKNKKIYSTNDIDVNNILIFEKEPYGNKNSFKYFSGYNDNDVIRPLCIILPQITGYVRKLDENGTMSFIVKDKQLLKKYAKQLKS